MHRTGIVLRPEIRAHVKVLFDAPLESPEVLLHDVENHARTVEIVSKRKRPRQLPLSRALTKGLKDFLASLNENSTPAQRHLVQAACKYFVENQEGGDHDLASDTGLDDDAEVFIAVARWLKREDLAEEVEAILDATP